MQPISRENLNDNYVFGTVIPQKDYQDVEKVIVHVQNSDHRLNDLEKGELAEYIKGMNGEVFNKVQNAHLLSKIRKIMFWVGWENCSNVTFTELEGKGKEVKGNKMILASESIFFEKLLFGNFKEADQEKIQIDIPSEILEYMVEFLRVGNWTKFEKEIADVFSYADKYLVTEKSKLLGGLLADEVLFGRYKSDKSKLWEVAVSAQSKELIGAFIYKELFLKVMFAEKDNLELQEKIYDYCVQKGINLSLEDLELYFRHAFECDEKSFLTNREGRYYFRVRPNFLPSSYGSFFSVTDDDILPKLIKLLNIDALDLENLNINDPDGFCRKIAQLSGMPLSLNLRNSSINGDDYNNFIIKLCEIIIENNIHIKDLYLDNNKISDEGAKALAHLIKESRTLKKLDLSQNSISNKGAEALAEALKENNSLEVLDLGNNRITDVGIKALALSLQGNNRLKKLGLHKNEIREKGCGALINALKKNKKLKTLRDVRIFLRKIAHENFIVEKATCLTAHCL